MTDLIATPGTVPGRATDDAAVVAELTDVVNQLRTDFRDRDTLYEYVDAVLFRDINIEIPLAYQKTTKQIHSPLPTHIANTIVAALTVNAPLVQFHPVGFGDVYTENATLREHFFESSWVRQQQEAKDRLFRRFMYSLVTKGSAVYKTVERTKSAWAAYDAYADRITRETEAKPHLDRASKDAVIHAKTEEFKRQQPYPIATTVPPPASFYRIKGEQGFTFCCEVKQVPFFDTLATFNASLDSKGRVVAGRRGTDGEYVPPEALGLPRSQWGQVAGSTRMLTMLEAWTFDEVFYILCGPGQTSSQSASLARGTLVGRLTHEYGDPLTHTLRGPYFEALGVTTDSNLPDRAGLSILFGFLDLFPYLDSLLTIQSNAAFWTGFPAFQQVVPPGTLVPPTPYGRDGSEQTEEQIKPGSIYPYGVQPIEQPSAGKDLDKAIGLVRGLLELALPSAVQGVTDSADSGYALNQATHLARLYWDPIVDNAQIAHAERIGFESWLIENQIGEDVYVWGEEAQTRKGQKGARAGWLKLGPDDINGVHRYTVKLDPQTPSNRVIEVRTHTELLAQRLESREDAITELGGNPDEVERAWRLYDLKQDPAIQQKLRELTLQELSTIERKRLTPPADIGNVGSPVGGNAAMGGFGPSEGNVFTPGQQGQPLTPPPPGAGQGAPPGFGGNPAGTPVTPNPPGNMEPLPGQ